MALIKLVLLADGRAGPRAEEQLTAMQDMGDAPIPLAVSRFEEGDGWRVEAYYDAADEDDVGVLAPGLGGRDWRIDPVPDENWVAHVHATLKPVRAGRFLVHGPHDRMAAESEAFAIEIEASEAFGTAHHGSTLGCLRAIDALAAPLPAAVLDLGTGSGVLAIAVAKLAPAAQIIATDIDARSFEIAAENCAHNGVAERVRCLMAAGLDHPDLTALRFDLVLANILAEPLIALAPELTAATLPGGRMILAGLLAEQAEAVLAAYRMVGVECTSSEVIEGWSTLVLRRI